MRCHILNSQAANGNRKWSGSERARSLVRTSGDEFPAMSRDRKKAPGKKVNVKVDTLDIAPLRSGTPPQKRSGMARVLKGSHSFTCTFTRSSAIGMSHSLPAFAFPAAAGTHLPTPEGWMAE